MTIATYSSLYPATTELRYFSLARHALSAALRLLGVGRGDAVLLPEYICRDLLASLHEVGAIPVWYRVGIDLAPLEAHDNWPLAKAALVVNYFGFPQPLEPFIEYAQRSGASLIEDNAHGFLSRDSGGRLLGCRTGIGLFSFRKTFLLGRGAGLAVSDSQWRGSLPTPLPTITAAYPRAISVRRCLRTFCAGSRLPEYWLARLIRLMRQLRGLPAIPAPAPTAEQTIPEDAAPDTFLLEELQHADLAQESRRRRALYRMLDAEVKAAGLQPVFASLPDQAVPYGFPLLSDTPTAVATLAACHQLDYFKWPDLPDARMHEALPHYSRIYLINFL